MNHLLALFILCFVSILAPLQAEWKREALDCPWGIDSSFATAQKNTSAPIKKSAGIKTCETMILFFQKRITQIDGPRSHYYPTSSGYTLQAIRLYGVLNGIGLGCDRLLRENGEDSFYKITENYGVPRKINPVPTNLTRDR